MLCLGFLGCRGFGFEVYRFSVYGSRAVADPLASVDSAAR